MLGSNIVAISANATANRNKMKGTKALMSRSRVFMFYLLTASLVGRTDSRTPRVVKTCGGRADCGMRISDLRSMRAALFSLRALRLQRELHLMQRCKARKDQSAFRNPQSKEGYCKREPFRLCSPPFVRERRLFKFISRSRF